MQQIAILILAHKKPTQLLRLVYAMDDKRFDLFIHIDAKSNIIPFRDILKGLNLKSNVLFVENRVKTYFFDYSLIEATCRCAELAFSIGDYKYYILLSGQDYPIKSKDYIYTKLIENYPMCWIDMYNVAEAEKRGVNWVKNIGHYYVSQKMRRLLLDLVGPKFYFSQYGKSVKLFAVIYDRIKTALGYSPRLKLSSTSFKYSAGSHFWMLPDIAIKHILECFHNEKKLNNIFHHIGAPEESYFQTALSTMRGGCLLPEEWSQFKKVENEMDNPALRLIKWYENGVKTDGHPAIWEINDLPHILQAKALFARKFDESIDHIILDKLDCYNNKLE